MLAKRIIPCLDVRDGKVVKGVQFKNHKVLGGIIELASYYAEQGADELVFYDISASPEGRSVSSNWIKRVAKEINIPFCVAGGIRSVQDARRTLSSGADKVSINTPALENPKLISDLAEEFGSQCVVVGIDSMKEGHQYRIWKNTGSVKTMKESGAETMAWIKEVQERGAGEIVLNCMNSDGTRQGYDLEQLRLARSICQVPLIASGGAGSVRCFVDVFQHCQVDGALAASVFHKRDITIPKLKEDLQEKKIEVRR